MAKKKLRGVPELGARIKRFMAAADLDASELSARTGISTSYVSRILNGENVNPTIDFVKRIAAALEVTETELVREVEDGQAVKSKQQSISPPMPTGVNPAVPIPRLPFDSPGAQINRLIASRGFSEEQEKRVGAAVVEMVEQVLALIEPQRKNRKEP